MDPKPDYPEFYTGAPVDAPDLRYRAAFLEELWETLETRHVLLTAPRRTGKTSIMDHLRAYPKEGCLVVYENVQDLAHPADLFAALLARLHEDHPRFFRDKLGKSWGLIKGALGKIKEIGISEIKVALRDSDPDWRQRWREHGYAFLREVRKQESMVLLVVDELPDMLLNLGREDEKLLREFLAWFRASRQDPKPKHDRIRWLVGGSINLSSTLDALGMVDLINDFEDVPLPMLTRENVIDFVTTMLATRGVALDQHVAPAVAERLGRPIPLFMQMITLSLYRRWKQEPHTLTTADVDGAFTDLVASTAARDKLQHYYSRIGRYYAPAKATAAHSLLSRLSLSEAGLARNRLMQEFERILDEAGEQRPAHERKQQFNQLLRDLENDFYVTETAEGSYDFASGVLKSWWHRYYA